jgi:hypothetical protein
MAAIVTTAAAAAPVLAAATTLQMHNASQGWLALSAQLLQMVVVMQSLLYSPARPSTRLWLLAVVQSVLAMMWLAVAARHRSTPLPSS